MSFALVRYRGDFTVRRCYKVSERHLDVKKHFTALRYVNQSTIEIRHWTVECESPTHPSAVSASTTARVRGVVDTYGSGPQFSRPYNVHRHDD
jgi:hypothetical protein